MKNRPFGQFNFQDVAVVVLAHKRISHLLNVLNSLESSQGFDECKLIFACDRPSQEVRAIVENFSHSDKTILINRKVPQTTAQAINMNLFAGLSEAFRNTGAQIVIVLEDDIVVSPDFILFALEIFRRYSKNPYFRGLNLFSRMKCEDCASNQYVIGNFGLGWGWAISRTTFEKVCKFWSGTENNHWDFIVEPFCRTGFVVNPIRSRIKNIGMDETASHTSDEAAINLAVAIERSFNSPTSDHAQIKLHNQRFDWEVNYFQFQNRGRIAWISTLSLANLIFILYRCGTGQNRITMKIYSVLKGIYTRFGNNC